MTDENEVSLGAVGVLFALFAALVVLGVLTVALPEIANESPAGSDAGAESAESP